MTFSVLTNAALRQKWMEKNVTLKNVNVKPHYVTLLIAPWLMNYFENHASPEKKRKKMLWHSFVSNIHHVRLDCRRGWAVKFTPPTAREAAWLTIHIRSDLTFKNTIFVMLYFISFFYPFRSCCLWAKKWSEGIFLFNINLLWMWPEWRNLSWLRLVSLRIDTSWLTILYFKYFNTLSLF